MEVIEIQKRIEKIKNLIQEIKEREMDLNRIQVRKNEMVGFSVKMISDTIGYSKNKLKYYIEDFGFKPLFNWNNTWYYSDQDIEDLLGILLSMERFKLLKEEVKYEL